MSSASSEVTDKNGEPIEVGDKVWSRARGGKQEGEAEAILIDQHDVKNAGDLGVSVKNPPKVVYTNQHGHKVSHNPGTLLHLESE
ncbi:hypothetical protein BV25DRAFT_1852009 [Artomyces pyxidatus]|uniref:Uncharacterized protein n=1 Tax=Artomyces pyxidatus TaxID=48021 RepID=A0ACB8TAA7_9AGAM|nr:hypothetical protein BV25DRAFT_1852009 [Artomyces pyxidatus]